MMRKVVWFLIVLAILGFTAPAMAGTVERTIQIQWTYKRSLEHLIDGFRVYSLNTNDEREKVVWQTTQKGIRKATFKTRVKDGKNVYVAVPFNKKAEGLNSDKSVIYEFGRIQGFNANCIDCM